MAQPSETEAIRYSGYNYGPACGEFHLMEGEDISPRPWDLNGEVLKARPHDVLADIGCGTARKLIPLAPYFKRIFGIDIQSSMLQKAAENMRQGNVDNALLWQADTNNLPLPDQSIDIITYMLSPPNVKEAWRVLKPGGWVILERVAEDDKLEIKSPFGEDDEGPRGFRVGLPPGKVANDLCMQFSEVESGAGFEFVNVRSGKWQTRYTKEGIIELLTHTPTVRDFDPKKDRAIIRRMFRKRTAPEGFITATQHRVLLIARKQRISNLNMDIQVF
jgi:SAM-dependent methyltransferase